MTKQGTGVNLMKKAVVFGASGFIGSYILNELLNDSDYEQVIAVVRKPLNITHPKLKTVIGDYQSLPGLKENLVGDDVFISLGTTRKHQPNPKEYYQIDHDYPVLAAKIAKENGAKSVFIVTAVGADANSKLFYVRTKGEVERDIIKLNFNHTHIFQPSMLLGNRQEDRPLEKILIKIWGGANFLFFGGLQRYKGIEGKDVAKAMHHAAKHQTEKVKKYQWQDMQMG
jgi:uncharacterized protein YbjT (DUF2867 family)